MSESQVRVRELRFEADVWAALEEALEHQGDEAPFILDFSKADWAKFKVKYRGEKFDATLTPTAMQGIIGFQSTLYRSAAIVLRDAPDIRKLSEEEKYSLEVAFSVNEGSSDTEADAKGFLGKLAEAVGSMDSKNKLIVFLALIGVYFGVDGIKHYIDEKSKTEDRVALVQLSRDIMGHDEKSERLLAESRNQSVQVAEVQEQSFIGYDSLVRSSGGASSITIQGTELGRSHIEEIKRKSIQETRTFQVREEFSILSVDAQSPHGF